MSSLRFNTVFLQNVTAADIEFHEFSCFCMGTFYSLLYMSVSCKVIYIPTLQISLIGMCNNLQNCVLSQPQGGWGLYKFKYYLWGCGIIKSENP
jgi:hypothetical protein